MPDTPRVAPTTSEIAALAAEVDAVIAEMEVREWSERLHVVMRAVLAEMPADLADHWRAHLGRNPGTVAVRWDDDGMAVLIGGARFCVVDPGVMAPDAEEGWARVMVDGEERTLELRAA